MPSNLLLQFFASISLHLAITISSSSADSLCQTPQPLGMESGQIADGQLTASSTFDAPTLGPAMARIRKELGGGAWCPWHQINAESYEYIQVDLLAPYEIWAIEMQGRYGNGTGREFAEAIMVDFIGPAHRNWTRYGQMDEEGDEGKNGTNYNEMEQNQILPANRDERTPELIPLVPPLIASSLRIVPFSLQLRTICLRFELFGCLLSETTKNNGVELELIAVNSENVDSWNLAQWRQQIWQKPALLYPLAGLLSLLPLALFLLLLRHIARLHRHSQKPSLFSCSTRSSAGGHSCHRAACFSASSSSTSQPLRPSNSWQNVHLSFPFDSGIGGFSSAKIFSPSFCRFESVSMGWPSLGRRKSTTRGEGEAAGQQNNNCCANGGIWNNGLGEDGEGASSSSSQQNGTKAGMAMCRSKSMAGGTNCGGHKMPGPNQQQKQPHLLHQRMPPTIPSPPPAAIPSLRTVQLVHSCSQPADSILTRPIVRPFLPDSHCQQQLASKRGKKPIPKPRSITPLNKL